MTNIINFTSRLPKALTKRLADEARKSHRTRNGQLIDILETRYKANGRLMRSVEDPLPDGFEEVLRQDTVPFPCRLPKEINKKLVREAKRRTQKLNQHFSKNDQIIFILEERYNTNKRSDQSAMALSVTDRPPLSASRELRASGSSPN